MANLKFYNDERIMLDKLGFNHTRIMNKDKIIMIIKKLCRHFKIEMVGISFHGNGVSDTGSAFLNRRKVKLNHYPSYRLLIHELAHIYNHDNNLDNERYHTKKLMRTIKKFAKYVMKKNYWIKEEKVNEDEN